MQGPNIPDPALPDLPHSRQRTSLPLTPARPQTRTHTQGHRLAFFCSSCVCQERGVSVQAPQLPHTSLQRPSHALSWALPETWYLSFSDYVFLGARESLRVHSDGAWDRNGPPDILRLEALRFPPAKLMGGLDSVEIGVPGVGTDHSCRAPSLSSQFNHQLLRARDCTKHFICRILVSQ